MSNRLIREDLLTSERVLSLPAEGRWLFVAIMLSADDIGLFEATVFNLRRRADIGHDQAQKLLEMMVDVDLIRLYKANGKQYGFIPRFRQRVQIKRTKHPLPPDGLMADDPDAIKKIKDLASETTVGAPVGSGCATDGQPSEPEAEVEAKDLFPASQVTSSPSMPRRRKTGDRVPPCPDEQIVALWHEVLPELPGVRVLGQKRHKALAEFWKWILTSTKSDQTRRATNTAEGLAWIRGYFERARDNDFVMGRTSRGAGHEHWQADIEYVCSERGLKQVIEKTKAATA